MKIKPQTDFWTTRDGTYVRTCEMDDNHLINTIRMLERKSERIKIFYLSNLWGALNMFTSDASQDALNSEQLQIENSSVEDIIENFEVMELKKEVPKTANLYKLLRLEAKRRKLYDYEEEEEERIKSLFGVTLIGDFLK